MNHESQLRSLRARLVELDVDVVFVAINNSFGNFDDEVSELTQISGFSGSNGRAVVSADRALLCVDGRYTKQATEQTDNLVWEVCTYPDVDTIGLLRKVIRKNQTLAICPFSITYSSYLTISKISKELEFSIKIVNESIFEEKKTSDSKLFLMDEVDIGEPKSNRINKIRSTLNDGEAVMLTEKSIVGWCFGLRREKITDNKCVLPNCIAYIPKVEKPIIFCDMELENCKEDFIFMPFSKFEDVIRSAKKVSVNCDFTTTPLYFPFTLQNLMFHVKQSRIQYGEFEAIKNSTEVENLKTAAELTSAAFIKVLAYVESCKKTTEVEVIEVFENELRKNKIFVDLSFNAISSFGKNTSIVHYNPKVLGNSSIDSDGLFLFDAGAHFKNATTDMTRVIYRGDNPSDELCTIYTTILKSVIMFSTAKFPDRAKASSLDSLARFFVWQQGIDYNFGTGHGVGSFGNVHEHPRISQSSNEQITKNMVMTVEPGIYTKSFGIRLENMLLTKDVSRGYIEFETLSFIPFCRKMIKTKMLNIDEVKWINNYNKCVYEKFYKVFSDDVDTLRFLSENTKEV
ncbi:MAG: M24 family metallopeptidase [Holosporales bacterium]|jgi:Xaa-Pro aminopeptidase|nr:M24 family metallopeptidase [Holosporales bacterium]